jgi:hypothetical protein
MNEHDSKPKALFISPDGKVYPDSLICSGVLPGELAGKPCPFSTNGRIPAPQPLSQNELDYTTDKGQPGDLCPPCAKQQLSSLGHWQGYAQQEFPTHLLPLRLFKCRMWFWLVVPGLYDDSPTILKDNE